MNTLKLIVIVVSAFILNCGTETKEELTCGLGDKIEVDDELYCVYPKAITETGFRCPVDVGFRHDFDQGAICSAKEEMPPERTRTVGKKAMDKWGQDPGSSDMGVDGSEQATGEVGVDPKFDECEDIEKSGPYCENEVWSWTYDPATKRLTVRDDRALLNCCGTREIRAFKTADNTYELRETDDKPADADARCNCMCVFNYEISIENIEASTLNIKLIRNGDDYAQPLEWSETFIVSGTETAGQWTIDSTSSSVAGCVL